MNTWVRNSRNALRAVDEVSRDRAGLGCLLAVLASCTVYTTAALAVEPGVPVAPRMERCGEPYRHWTCALPAVVPDSPSTKEEESPADLTLHIWTRGAEAVQLAARSANGRNWREFDLHRLRATGDALAGTLTLHGHGIDGKNLAPWPDWRFVIELAVVAAADGHLTGQANVTVGALTADWEIVSGWQEHHVSEARAAFEASFESTAKTLQTKVIGTLRDAAAERAANAFADGADWPRWLGPEGTLRGQAPDRPMVTTLGDARLLWKAEAHMGPGKAQVNRYGGFGIGYRVPSSGASSPILADGKIYLYWYMPAGEAYLKAEQEKRGPTGYFMKSMWQTQADDHVACLDAATGERLWEAVYPLAGMTFLTGKSNLINSTPAVAEGVIVAVGGAGRVYCLDAETGEQRWQSFLPNHARWTQEAAAGKPAGGRARPHAVTIVAGNALVADEGGGLMAFRLADGSLAWHAKNVLGNQATPNVWRGDGVTLVLSQFDRSEGCPVRAIAPETGETLWQIEDLPEHPYKMASNFLIGDTLIVPGYLSQARQATNGNEERPQSIAGYRVSATGAEKIWELPAARYQINTHVGQGAMVALDDHRVAMYSTWHRTPAGNPAIWVVDIRGGDVVWEARKPEEQVDWGGNGDFVSCGDRLIKQVDPSHQSQQYHGWQISDEGLTQLWTGERFGPMEATSYEVPLVNPFVDGRLIVRHAFGIYCYDLRAPR